MSGKRIKIFKTEITLLVFLAALVSLTMTMTGPGNRAAAPSAAHFSETPGTAPPDYPVADTAETPGTTGDGGITVSDSAVPGASPDTTPSAAQDDERYIRLRLGEYDIHLGNLILVNYEHVYEIPDNNKLVRVSDNKSGSYILLDGNAQLSETIMKPLNAMMDDFAAATGIKNVLLYSSFRTYDKQQAVFNDWAQRVGKEEAERMAAQPGYSEHHTGLAFDIAVYSDNVVSTFKGTGKYAWIHENAYNYGFVLRYPDEKQEITRTANEPWHFRYIGAPHAYLVTQSGYCYEEYIEYLRRFDFYGEHLTTVYNDVSYEIYHVTGTRVPVPSDRPYTLSGDNIDGFIVTVNNGRVTQEDVTTPEETGG